MKLRPAAVLFAVVAVLSTHHVAFAQAAPASPSRADVKAETRAAEKSGQLAPAGEGAEFSKPTRSVSTKTRAERKSETRAARRSGDLEPTGEASDLKAEKAQKMTKSTKTRAERKGETMAARRAQQLVPAGEGPGAPAK